MDWQAKPPQDENRTKFKSNFTAVQKMLKKISGPTVLQAGYYHTNMVASQLRDSLTSHNDEVVAMLQ